MFSKVCFHADSLVVEMIRNLLEDNGLHPLPVSNTMTCVEPVQGARGSYVEVPDQEADLARTILSEKENLRKYVVTVGNG